MTTIDSKNQLLTENRASDLQVSLSDWLYGNRKIVVDGEPYDVIKLHNLYCWRLRHLVTKEIVNFFYPLSHDGLIENLKEHCNKI